MPIVKTLAKGQVVIPAEIRKKIGLKPGRKVLITVESERRIALEPLPEDPIRDLRGVLRGGPSLTRALLQERRRDIQHEEKKFARLIRRHGLASKRKGRSDGRGSPA